MSAPAITATSFFERILPSKLRESGAAYRAVSGTICFVIFGEGTWTVTFGCRDVAKAVRREALCLDGDLVAGFRPDVFARFLSGQSIEAEKGCYFDGDLRLLEKLGRLLNPAAQGVLGIRSSAA